MAAGGAASLVGGLLGLVLAAPVCAQTADAWRFVRDDDGIVVHRRPVEGSSLDELRGTGVVDAPIAAVLGVLQDTERGKEWMFNCVDSATLERNDDGSYVVYNRTSTPWPLADRDVVVRGRRVFEPTRVRVAFESIDFPVRPPTEGVVRMPFLRGHWILVPEARGEATRVEYQMHANPGGALPTWVVNGFAKSLPYETIRKLRAQVVRRRYPEVERALLQRPDYRTLVGAP